MIDLIIPFSLEHKNQIPQDLVFKKNIGLEGNLFNINKLTSPSEIRKINSQLEFINKTYPGSLKSLHFPTENANYLLKKTASKALYKFIDIASNFDIPIVIIHSNFIQTIDNFNIHSLNYIRTNFIEYFKLLNGYARSKNVIICIENMPIIGSQGIDYDSVFVFPEDFNNLEYTNIKITWDLCHWAYTYCIISQLSNFSSKIKVGKISFDDFFKLINRISYFHFGSFSGIVYPHTNNQRYEGIPPGKGFPSEELFIKSLRKIYSLKTKFGLALEIRERDYKNRINLREVLAWFENNIFNQHYKQKKTS